MAENNTQAVEKVFKKGELIYHQGDYLATIFDLQWGRVALYSDYGTPNQRLMIEIVDEGFFGLVGFLESRPQNATAIALEKSACSLITRESFSQYFQSRPAKIMSIMQYMSRRMRVLSTGYLEASQALAEYADAERLLRERKEWYEQQQTLQHRVMSMFGLE